MRTKRLLCEVKAAVAQIIEHDGMLLHSFLCMERQRTGKRMKAADGFVAFDYQIREKAVSGQLCERNVKQRILIEKSLTVSAPQGIQLLFAAKIQAVEVFGCNAAVLRQQMEGLCPDKRRGRDKREIKKIFFP